HGAWTVRVNTIGGGTDTLDTVENEWFSHPEYDLAVRPFFHLPSYKFTHVQLDQFLTQDILSLYDIGPGDPAYAIGRFVNFEGRQRNTPTVRFGQIAQMPFEKITCDGMEQESFLVEIRSLGGYSGSPVFVFLDAIYKRPPMERDIPDGRRRSMFEQGPWLLGVDWCMIPSWERVCDASGQELKNGWQVPANSGMMGVIPAWHLQWLLTEYEPVVRLAKRLQEDALRELQTRPPVALPTASDGRSAPADPTEKNPTHREDFNRLL